MNEKIIEKINQATNDSFMDIVTDIFLNADYGEADGIVWECKIEANKRTCTIDVLPIKPL